MRVADLSAGKEECRRALAERRGERRRSPRDRGEEELRLREPELREEVELRLLLAEEEEAELVEEMVLLEVVEALRRVCRCCRCRGRRWRWRRGRAGELASSSAAWSAPSVSCADGCESLPERSVESPPEGEGGTSRVRLSWRRLASVRFVPVGERPAARRRSRISATESFSMRKSAVAAGKG